MESAEDDTGAVQDAARQPSTRENTCEMLSGEVSAGNSQQVLTLNAIYESSTAMEDEVDRSRPTALGELADRLSPPIDAETCHNTETILNMIDEFIDEPKVPNRSKCFADSTVSSHSLDVRGDGPSSALEFRLSHSASSRVNCIDSVSPDLPPIQDVSQNIPGSTDKEHNSEDPAKPPDIKPDSSKSQEMVNIISSTNKTAVTVPVKNIKILDEDINQEKDGEFECLEKVNSISVSKSKFELCERTSSDSVSNKQTFVNLVGTSSQSDSVKSVASNLSVHTEQSSSVSVCDPVDSSSKSENLPGQRRKLIRPASLISKPLEVVKSHSVKSDIQHSPEKTTAEKLNVQESSKSTSDHNSSMKPGIISPEETTSISPKKVKLVRHSTVKAQPVTITSAPQPSVSVLVDSSFTQQTSVSSHKQLSPRLSKVEDVRDRQTEAEVKSNAESEWSHHSKENLPCVEYSPVVASEVNKSDSGSILRIEHYDSDNNIVDSNRSKQVSHSENVICEDSSTSDNKLTDKPIENKTYNSLVNNVELGEDHNLAPDKSNDVLDVRKVSPLRLSRSIIDESLSSNIKTSVITHDENITNEVNSDEPKNVPKLTLKLSKSNEETKSSGKLTKLNIKAVKPPETNYENLKSSKCSKSKDSEYSEEVNDHHKHSHHSNIVKLNIKPVQMPKHVTEEELSKDKSSSSSEMSESDSSENETMSQCIQSPTVETTECDKPAERSVPKLTIKSLSTVPKVDCEISKHRGPKKGSPIPDSSAVTKLNIKPLIPPPIEKMTIKLNKSHESENKSENDVTSIESVPKMTIKLGKSHESIDILDNNCDEEKHETLKMKIKLAKLHENSSEKNENPGDISTIPRSSKRISQKTEVCEMSVPKLTIKIPQEHELRSSERSANSPSIPKLTIKPILKPEESDPRQSEQSHSPTIPKLTIKPILKPEDYEAKMESSEHPVVPKLTIKPLIKPDDNDVCQSMRSASPTVHKLTIKAIGKHDELESKLSDTSDSHTVPKLTIKTVTKNDEHESRHCERVDSPTVPKLTIKPVVKPDDHESMVLETDSHTIPKLTIKTVTKSDEHEPREPDSSEVNLVPKLTIKTLIKPEEHESKKMESTDSHAIPKITIKPVLKPDDHDLKHSQRSDSPTVTKLTIKSVIKPDEHDSRKIESSDSHVVPKLTIKPVKSDELDVKNLERSASPAIPKLTIKPLHKPDLEYEQKVSETLELHIPKLTIKSIVKPEEHEISRIQESSLVSKAITSMTASEESPSSSKSLSKHSKENVSIIENTLEDISEKYIKTKSTSALEEVDVESKSAMLAVKIDTECSKSSFENTLDVHTQDSSNKAEVSNNCPTSVKSVPAHLGNLLEIVTSSPKDPLIQESGLDSPRIILKINKTNQGSTSEILTEKNHKKIDCDTNSVESEMLDEELCKPKVTGDISTEQSNESSLPSNTKMNSDDGACFKDKVSKESSCNKTLTEETEDSEELSKENVGRILRTAVKRTAAKSDSPKRCSEVETTVDVKRKKLDKIMSNSHLTVTKVSKMKTHLDNSNKKGLRSKTSVSVLSLGSKEEKISSDLNKVKCGPHSILSKNIILSNNGESKFHDILANLNTKSEEKTTSSLSPPLSAFSKINEISSLVEADSNTTSTTASSEDTMSESTNRLGTESPIFNKVDRDLLTLNEGSSSQECILMDDLSQDPLDIESIAKTHFIPVKSNTGLSNMKNSIVNIMAKSPLELVNAVPVTPQPRKRGRPRKIPLPEGAEPPPPKTPKIPTPALEERPVRILRTPRDRPAILRTPRTRGRGRGSRRGANSAQRISNSAQRLPNSPQTLSSSPQRLSDSARRLSNSATRETQTTPLSPIETATKFFLNINSPPESTPLKSSMSCQVAILRLGESSQYPVLEENSESSKAEDDSVKEETMQEGNEEEACVGSARGRGRGRGRGSPRRGRGGRHATRGRGSRGGRVKGGQRGEEIQLQDALPLTEIKREGRKSKLEPTLTPALQVFEEETCMIGDNGTPHRNVGLLDEESQSSVLSGITTESGGKCKRTKLMDMLDEGHKEWTPADVAEYDWPPDGTSTGEPTQTVMIQEQVALYLGVKSFKRRYPDLKRRPLCADEKNYIRDRGLISEALCDLGVTAVDAGEVLDIMYTDYPTKYEEYRKHLRERRETKPPPSSVPKPVPSATPIVQQKSKQEVLEKACESAAAWNARLNRQRRTERPASLDLQTLTLHRPRRPQPPQPQPTPPISHYPIALLPGQYTDYYRSYAPEELRYFPLNTVLNLLPSPKRSEETSDESDSGSDISHSSDDDSQSETSEKHFRRKGTGNVGKSKSRPSSPTEEGDEGGTCSREPSQPPPPEIPNRCKLCGGTEHCNRKYPHENFVICATCHKKIHPSCLEMAPSVAKCVRGYPWQCADCKCCDRCGDLADDDKMLFCDLCDRGYHIYCVGLRKVPTGRWHCVHCAVCRSCGSRSPSGPSSGVDAAGVPIPQPSAPDAPPDQWHHHLKKSHSGQRVYSHTLCAPCARAWRSGRFCPSCEKCFVGRKGAMGLVICNRCDRRFHQECVRRIGKPFDVLNFRCSDCRRGNIPKHKFRRGERPRKRQPQPSAETSNLSIITDSNSSLLQIPSSMDITMDQGGDSSCAIDSEQQSPSQDRNCDSNSLPGLTLKRKASPEELDQENEDSLPLQKSAKLATSSSDVDFKGASRRLFTEDAPSVVISGGEISLPQDSTQIQQSQERLPSESPQSTEIILIEDKKGIQASSSESVDHRQISHASTSSNYSAVQTDSGEVITVIDDAAEKDDGNDNVSETPPETSQDVEGGA